MRDKVRHSGGVSAPKGVGRAIRTPRAAAIAGIAFSVIFTVALLLIRTAVPDDPADAGRWLSDSSRRGAVLFALSLVPFAGIAFLWFVGVLRDRVGEDEDRFFATVFLPAQGWAPQAALEFATKLRDLDGKAFRKYLGDVLRSTRSGQ